MYIMGKKLFAPFLILFACTSTQAQTRLLTPEEAVATALQHNYNILLLKNDSLVDALNYDYRNYALYPRLNAISSVAFNNNNAKQKLADGSQKSRSGLKSNNIQNAVNLNWTIFDGFKMFITRDKWKEYVAYSGMNIQNTMNETVAAVLQTYYNIVRQKQQLRAITEQMGLNEERLRLANKKLGVGLGAKPEVLQATLDLNAQKASRLNQLSLIQQLKIDLNTLMTVDDTTDYDVVDTIVFKKNLTAENIFSEAKANNPELKLIEQNKRINEFTLREVRAARMPVVTLNTAYNFNRSSNQAVVNSFTPLLNQNHGFNYGLTLSVPIFNGYVVRRNIKEAEINIAQQDLLYKQKEIQLTSGVRRAFQAYLLQLDVLELEEANIKAAKENVYISQERLRLGITTVLELREAQKSLEDVYNRLIAARYNAKVAEINLIKISGGYIQK